MSPIGYSTVQQEGHLQKLSHVECYFPHYPGLRTLSRVYSLEVGGPGGRAIL